ncbi:hypothetical protein Undi14_10620 [Undibacterium sp. 14-3-2]|uniref:hypothetical protein n=1 Tax=Undibacterium sp. 14-3-2 TaxID=2800129 RepID=UPI001908DC53|nr:hypothetical protein [Undibacterium sp. 14-3-2]MBK1890491.1 hypothetical protein [Undibacterium sp. 14-3-2]
MTLPQRTNINIAGLVREKHPTLATAQLGTHNVISKYGQDLSGHQGEQHDTPFAGVHPEVYKDAGTNCAKSG